MKINLRTSLAGLVAAMVALAAADASAMTRTVTNTLDSGTGSLRDTIAASAANDTIVFSNNVVGAITLTSGELVIARNLTIIGPGANVLAVSGNNASRVFNVTAGTVNISNLTISNGAGGGFGGGGRGGGIYNGGALTLNNCTLSGNHDTFGDDVGGGIDNVSTLTLNNCTLSGNSGGPQGGGGAISNFGGTLTLNDCTLSGNANFSGGGIYTEQGTLTLNDCTLSDNAAGYGGGIYQEGDGVVIILNTIIANNTAPDEFPDVYVIGRVSSQGHNLIGKADTTLGWVGSDLTGTSASPLNPLLGPLQDNGGPTFTMALLPGSAGIDAGDDSVTNSLATDQRGRHRLSGAHVDIGAYEVNPPLRLVVTNTHDNGPGSLRDRVVFADPGDSISFAPGLTGTITLTSGELLIGKNATILGPTAAGVTVSGNHASRVFHITAGTVSISHLTIANGNTSGAGGGVFNELGGTLSLTNCTLNANTSSGGGGAVANNGAVTAVNCTFYGNHSNGGGGLYNYAGTLNLFNSTVVSNSVTLAGGGVWNYPVAGSLATIRSTIVAGNSAPGTPDVNGGFVSQGYNLVGNTSGSAGFGATADRLNVNALLGPLADHGGPTFTVALRAGSPAIDQGNSFGITTDQRGQARTYDNPSIGNATGGDGSDIGAVEFGSSGLWAGTVDLGGGWQWLAWFGYFNTNPSPWIYHWQHGWLYPVGTSTSSIFFWDPVLKGGSWWWSSASYYPYLYRFSDSSWLWYQKDTVNPRWFYNLTAAKWESW